jgi:hypothetical protein
MWCHSLDIIFDMMIYNRKMYPKKDTKTFRVEKRNQKGNRSKDFKIGSFVI